MKQTKHERLEHFRSLYENARMKYAPTLTALEQHMKQYRGDPTIDGSSEEASMVRNITYEMIESQISSEIPPPKVDAAYYSEKRDRNAKSIERLCASLRDKLPFESMNDLDERYTYIYGSSIWFIEWDADGGHGMERGSARVSCLSPKDFIPQPGVSSISDMDYCFLRFLTTKQELSRTYGLDQEDALLCTLEADVPTVSDEDTVSLILCFYKDEEGEVGKFAFSGDAVLSDVPKYYKRKVSRCTECGEEEGTCKCEKANFTLHDDEFELLSRRLLLRDGTAIEQFSPVLDEHGHLIEEGGDYRMQTTEIPYYTPKSFPIVIRKNTSLEGSIYGQSDCEFLRPHQQAINKIESRILQKLLRAGITPIIPEDATVTLNNSVFGQLIKMKPGESASQYGKVDTTPDISQDIAEAERLYHHAKRILGVSDAFVGIDNSRNESGYARQLQIDQASGRFLSKKKMKHTAYAEIDRLLFEHYLAFSDEPRRLSWRDAYGRIHDAEFNRYDFLEFDLRRGEYLYDDAYLFSVDLNGGAEGQRQQLWERNLENLRSGALGDLSDVATLLRYWQAQERAHYPFARENVEYFTLAYQEKQERERSQYDAGAIH